MTETAYGYSDPSTKPNSGQSADVYHPRYPDAHQSKVLSAAVAVSKVEVASYDCSQPQGGPVRSR